MFRPIPACSAQQQGYCLGKWPALVIEYRSILMTKISLARMIDRRVIQPTCRMSLFASFLSRDLMTSFGQEYNRLKDVKWDEICWLHIPAIWSRLSDLLTSAAEIPLGPTGHVRNRVTWPERKQMNVALSCYRGRESTGATSLQLIN